VPFIPYYGDRTDAGDVRDIIAALIEGANGSGWAEYTDRTYTEESPLQLAADTPALLTNDAADIREAEKPSDIDTFYDPVAGKILGKPGDAYTLTIDFTAKPTDQNTTLLEWWLDIGGVVGELYRRPFSFPKGANVARNITFTSAVFTLDTWEDNGALSYLQANGTCDIYDIVFKIFRTHKARGNYT
jgi:hypothetical protein